MTASLAPCPTSITGYAKGGGRGRTSLVSKYLHVKGYLDVMNLCKGKMLKYPKHEAFTHAYNKAKANYNAQLTFAGITDKQLKQYLGYE
ncbi:hypothetical protein [Vibrio harveyi]|uniref:hypothetical protein n=1 Tax=Vibrio harveyi TaxID=669 RepID=UPI0018F20730|nr:hypothetical protein [Vibrio harveyi]